MIFKFQIFLSNGRVSASGVVANVLDCDIILSEFEPVLKYQVHFQVNIPKERCEYFYPLSSGLNSNTAVILHGWFWK